MADSTAEPEVQLRMFSQPRFLAAVRALVGTMAQRLGFKEMQCGQISLAVDEALCNVITHGYERKPDGHQRKCRQAENLARDIEKAA